MKMEYPSVALLIFAGAIMYGQPGAAQVTLPVACGADQTSCAVAGVKGSHMPNYCIPKRNGNCNNHCGVVCGCNQDFCSGERVKDSKGCRGRDFCKDIKRGNNGVHCRPDCSLPCNLTTHLQCSHGKDGQGCSKGDYCLPIKAGSCTATRCPATCAGNEIPCAGKDDKQCITSSWCIPPFKLNEVTTQVTCPNTCTPFCRPNESKCQSRFDAAGCRKADYCIPQKGPACPKDPIDPANNCFILPPVNCGRGTFRCTNGVNPKGCKMPDTCVKVNGNCSNICPKQCGRNEMLCPIFNAGNNCPVKLDCLPITIRTQNGTLCQAHCPVQCPTGFTYCPGMMFSSGCTGPAGCAAPCTPCPKD